MSHFLKQNVLSKKFLSLIALLAALVGTISAQNKTYCKNFKFSKEWATSNQYSTYCVYYKKNCLFEICAKGVGFDYNSPTDPCADPNALYFTNDSSCPERFITLQCLQFDSPGPSYVPTSYSPVCAAPENCKGKNCTKTFETIHKACNSTGVKQFQPGVCKSDRHYCKPVDRTKTCHSIKKSPVCAIYFDNSTSTDLYEKYAPADNACEACRDPAITSYKIGTCRSEKGSDINCLPNNRPSTCPKEHNLVCGFSDSLNIHKQYSNPCLACQDHTVNRYQSGKCRVPCSQGSVSDYNCQDGNSPICGGFYANNTKVSFAGPCSGCIYNYLHVDFYTDGLCPGDEGIYCKYKNPLDGGTIISPVCAVTKKGCKSVSCRKSYPASYAACSDPSVIFYTGGMCPGDEGFSCKDLSYPNTFENVCGYTQRGCTNNSCRQSYVLSTQACSNPSVIFFKAGPC